MHHRARDLTGMKYNYLTAVSYAGSDGKKSIWNIRCEACGRAFTMPATEFLRGKQKSCGCLRYKLISESRTTHGLSKHPLYYVWRSMKERCLLPTAQAWDNYGGRGIKVFDRLLENFENFWADMSPTYHPGLSIDRIDVNGDYCPENCRWVSYKTQGRNKRYNRVIESPWGEITVAEASEKSGIGVTTLLYRIDNGCPNDMLFATPDVTNRFTTSKTQARATDSQ